MNQDTKVIRHHGDALSSARRFRTMLDLQAANGY
jgi:hypothetical protein